jgi:hypothetical protein
VRPTQGPVRQATGSLRVRNGCQVTAVPHAWAAPAVYADLVMFSHRRPAFRLNAEGPVPGMPKALRRGNAERPRPGQC